MRAAVLAIGGGTLGFWNGLREVFLEAREGRCSFHKTGNVLAALPKSAHRDATFVNGKLIERSGENTEPEAA